MAAVFHLLPFIARWLYDSRKHMNMAVYGAKETFLLGLLSSGSHLSYWSSSSAVFISEALSISKWSLPVYGLCKLCIYIQYTWRVDRTIYSTSQAVAQSERATGEPDVCRQSLLTVCFIWLDVLMSRAGARTKWQMANLKVAITCDQRTVVGDRLDSTLSCSHLITGS